MDACRGVHRVICDNGLITICIFKTTGGLLIFQWLCFGTALFDAAVVLPPANVQNRRDRPLKPADVDAPT